jgi:predicted branched-subunit amino acid permease
MPGLLLSAAHCARTRAVGCTADRMPSPAAPAEPSSYFAACLAGWRAAWTSVFCLVLFGTYVGIGALSHSYAFSLPWLLLSTLLVWAGPAQVILVSALGAGAGVVETAVAVGLSGVRLLPMVVALLPLLKQPETRTRELVLPAHLTAVSMWIESLRLLPTVPRQQRLAFCNGLGSGFMAAAQVGSLAGFYLAASLPALLTAGLLFLTPMSFLVSTARNSKMLVDQLALGLGLLIGPLLAYAGVELDLMWTGIVAGSAAFAVHRWREARP